MKIRIIGYAILLLLFPFRSFAQVPSNDDPCNATPLTIGTVCTYTQYTNANATASVGVPAPGCSVYSGGDVWFQVTVPASGSLIFDTDIGVITDGGMALYTGTCGSLTLLSCDDDASANGLMPSITQNGLTPGSTLFVRFWEYDNDNNGTFSICVRSSTPCTATSTNSSCAAADPFCTGNTYDYCNTVGVPSIGGSGIYGCLLSAPNPAFYFMNVQTSGPINFNISQQTNAGVGIDVDFIIWGPFASQASMCANISAGNIVGCSYSTAAIENASIPSALAGEWYMILLTNYSNQAGSVQFSQTNSGTPGAGTTNCNFITAVPGPCSGGTYTLNGILETDAPPTTGTVTITNSCGGSVTLNAPFANSINYSIPNLCGAGNACTVSAVYSAAGAPTILPTTYTATSCNTLTAVAGPCVSGVYTVTGTLVSACLPTTGTLTISSSCGGSVVYNAPFINTLNYTIPNIPGNGGSCTVTAVYSNPTGPIVPPATYAGSACCNSDAGTTTVSVTNGTMLTTAGITTVALCPGGAFNLISNNNYILPPDYDPGFDNAELFYAIYTAGGPTTNDPGTDPNWTGYFWTDKDFSVVNSGGYSTNSNGACSPLLSLPGLSTTNNTLVLVAITADDGDNGLNWNGVVNNDQNGDGCFDLGDPVVIKFLDPIVITSSPSCSGTVNIQIFGGLPAVSSSLYSITNTGNGTLSQSTTNVGGIVSISGLSNGQSFSVSVTDGNGCTKTFSGVYSNTLAATLTPAAAAICQGNCTNLTATVNSVGGNISFNSTQCTPSIPDAGISSTCHTGPASCAGSWVSSGIVVSGVCDPTWTTGEYLTVCLDISHTYDSDLEIWLQAPNGVYYLLSNNNGGGGNNYAGTCFSATAVTAITAGAAPFAGTFKPEGGAGNFAALSGTPTNGTWNLFAADNTAGDVGSINNWSITFFNPSTYTYAWTPTTGLSATNILNPVACPTSTTTYTLTVTNSCGCTATASSTLTVNGPIVPLFNSIGPICSGSVAPTLPTTSTNGITGSWLPATISNTISGTYTFTPTVGVCATTTTLSVVVTSSPTLSAVITNPLCFGSANGSINLTANGGLTPYTFSWSNGASSEDLSGLAPGSYTVTVTSASGCTTTLLNTVINPSLLAVSITATTNVLCNGNATGSATALASGGTSAYTYQWSTGAATATINNLTAGTYTVTATDANGCTKSTTVVISQPASIVMSIATIQSISCFNGSNGILLASSIGGVSPYQYQWSNGSAIATANNIAGGLTYTVTVSDANGCTSIKGLAISQPSQLQITLNASVNVLCYGGNNGSISTFSAGGSVPYTYVWSNGASTASLSSLVAGVYTLTVTDSKGCVSNLTQIISEPPIISNSISAFNNVSCNGGTDGTLQINTSGGNPGYTYQWSPNVSTTFSATNLIAGLYVITVTDQSGCKKNFSTTITQPVVLSNTVSVSNVTCSGGSNGSITASPLGGTAPYSYQWLPIGGNASTASGLIAGNYSVTITDANGCAKQSNATVSAPAVIALTMTSSASACGASTGSASVVALGGAGSYSYSWSPISGNAATLNTITSGAYQVNVTDGNGCSTQASVNVASLGGPTVSIIASTNVSCFGGSNGSATVSVSSGIAPYSYIWIPSGGNGSVASNLAAGSYSVNVADVNGCVSSANIVIAQPTALTSSVVTAAANCSHADGLATVFASGGNSPYTYNWSVGGIAGSSLSSFVPGSYLVTVTDSRNCTSVAAFTIGNTPGPSVSVFSSNSISCQGGTNGQVNISTFNGTAPYSYLWSNGSLMPSLSGVPVGAYTVTVTDANGCTANVSSSLTALPAMVLTFSTTSATCNNSNGSASVSIINGSYPYSYSWSSGSVTSNAGNYLLAGNYSVTVMDINGCTATGNVIVNNAGGPLPSVASTTNVSCFGLSNGAASVLVTSGATPYSYQWFPTGGSASSASNLAAGNYSVNVTDANGCVANVAIVVGSPAALLVSSNPTSVLCKGGNTGGVLSLVSGGTSPYNYLWNTGALTSGLSNIVAGSYTLTVTDSHNCATSLLTTVSEPAAIVVPVIVSNNNCNGGSSGAIQVNAAGGISPYTYLWSTGYTGGPLLTGAAANTYSVTVTDANGCKKNNIAVVSQSTAITALNNITNATCNASNGSVSLTMQGGTSPYTYLWSNGAATSSVTNVVAGIYTVTVADFFGCIYNNSYQVSNVGAPALALQSVTNVLCNNSSTGSATVQASGGVGPYVYSWSPVGGSASSASNLAAGNYIATATDANGCQVNLPVVITEPTAINITLTTTNASCGNSNGTVTSIVIGGVGAYTYHWSSSVANVSGLSSLAPGNYSLSVSDANGCVDTQNYNIAAQGGPSVALASLANVSCYGGSNGAASVALSGGIGPFAYSWLPIGGNAVSASNLPAGSYTVNVTDANGCITPFNILVTQPDSISLILSSSVSTCGLANGSVVSSVSGGTGVYTYIWSNAAISSQIVNTLPGTYTVTITDANSCSVSRSTLVNGFTSPLVTVSSQTNVSCNGGNNGSAQISVNASSAVNSYLWSNGSITQNAQNLVAGNYTVTVTDLNGCSGNTVVVVSQPSAITITPSYSNANCGQSNGSASVVVAGGVSPFTYLWNNGNTTASVNNVLAAAYSVTVTDANGCTKNQSIAVANNGAPILTLNTITHVLCNGSSTGVISASVSGGASPYVYAWSPQGGNNLQTTQLPAGNYSLTATDQNGCVTVINATINEPSSISTSVNTVPASCNQLNGSIAVNATGGSGALSFLWNNNAISSSLNNIASGVYTLTVTDANGCSASQTYAVPGLGGPTVAMQSAINASCFGKNDGTASVLVSSGNIPYTYNWIPFGGNQSMADSLAAGTYTVNVADVNGCLTSVNVVIAEPTAVVASVTGLQMTNCYGQSNGDAFVQATGGSGTYTYLWSNGNNLNASSLLSAGAYSVTVTDANGCTGLTTFSIAQPDSLVIDSLLLNNISCNALNDGSASVSVIGGTSPYTYQWSNTSVTSADIYNMAAGNYTITVTDDNGCVVYKSFSLVQPSPLVVIPTVNNVKCAGGNTGSISVIVSGSNSPYQYSWSSGSQTSLAQNLVSGTYSVVVTDNNGCMDTVTSLVDEPDTLNVQNIVSHVRCAGQSTGAVLVVPSGGVSPYSILWNNNQLLGFAPSGIMAGNYTAVISDVNGCTTFQGVQVNQPALLNAMVAVPSTLCIGQFVTLQVNAVGGTPAYNYQWSNGANADTIRINPSITTSYAVTVTDANGCVVPIINTNVSVYPPLSLNLSVSNDTICEGQSVLLSCLANGGNGGPYTYQWNNIATGSSQSVSPDTTSSFSVILTDGCGTPFVQALQTVVVNPIPVPDFLPNSIKQCMPISALFISTSQTTAGSSYSWTFGDNTFGSGSSPTHYYNTPGVYDVSLTITNSFGCSASLSKNDVVIVYDLPTASFSTEQSVVDILAPQVTLLNRSTGASIFNWAFGDNTSSIDYSPSHLYADTGSYQIRLIAISQHGCRDTAYETIHVIPDFSVFIPSAFSPNDDWYNEGFTGYGVGIKSASFKIFDRWGELIYISDSLGKPWDGTFSNSGKPCAEGIYVYLFDVVSFNNEPHQYSGRVSLVR